MTLAPTLLTAPVAGLVPVDPAVANELLIRWGHDLGPCNRPFGMEGWTFDIDGVPVSVAVSASIVSDVVEMPDGSRLRCGQVVELARLCSDPANRWATRPMLRLWREVAAPRWSYWPVEALVSYSTRRHQGDLYRWDGWTLVKATAGSSGGGSWSKPRTAGHAAAGSKRLWVYRPTGKVAV